VWDARSGRPLLNLRGHDGRVFGVAWCAADDADLVASGSDDQTVRLWRLSSQLKSSRFTTPPSLAKAEPNVRAIEAQSAGPVPHPAALAEGTALGEAELVAAQSGDGSKGPAAAAEPSAAVRAKVGAAGPSGSLGKGPAAMYGAASKAKKGKSLLPQLSQLVVSSNLEAVQRNVQARNSCPVPCPQWPSAMPTVAQCRAQQLPARNRHSNQRTSRTSASAAAACLVACHGSARPAALWAISFAQHSEAPVLRRRSSARCWGCGAARLQRSCKRQFGTARAAHASALSTTNAGQCV
jgi:hypothetical protein